MLMNLKDKITIFSSKAYDLNSGKDPED